MEEREARVYSGVKELAHEIIDGIPVSLRGNTLCLVAGSVLYKLARAIQDNNYGVRNCLSGVNEMLGRSTSLASGTGVFTFSSFMNIYLAGLRDEALKNGKIRQAKIWRAGMYAIPLISVSFYAVCELMGGVTTPDIGPDSFSGDIVSGVIGGSIALLATLIIDKRNQK